MERQIRITISGSDPDTHQETYLTLDKLRKFQNTYLIPIMPNPILEEDDEIVSSARLLCLEVSLTER